MQHNPCYKLRVAISLIFAFILSISFPVGAYAQGSGWICGSLDYVPDNCESMHRYCPGCPDPSGGTCDRVYDFPVVPANKRCVFAGRPEPVGASTVDPASGPTKFVFSNRAGGTCEIPDPVYVTNCTQDTRWVASCTEGAQFRVRLSGPGAALSRLSRCCHDVGDTARCQNIHPGPCPSPGCNLGCPGHEEDLRFYGKQLDNTPPHLGFPARWPIPGDPDNTDPQWSDTDGNNATCIMELLFENRFTVHGGDDLTPPMVKIIPMHGVTCTSKNPLQAFNNTEMVLQSNCGGETYAPVNVSHVYFDNGCGPGFAEITCTFPFMPQWSDSVTASSMCPSWLDSRKWSDHRPFWDQHIAMVSNDSGFSQGKICCCVGDDAACCAQKKKAVITD